MTPQQEFDFTPLDPAEQELRDRWARNAAEHAAEWTEERLCIAWVTESDGRHWLDWWAQLPSYERDRWLHTYRFERQMADHSRRPMRPPHQFVVSKEETEQDRAIIDAMIRDIRQAAMERRPLPWTESNDMDGRARFDFRRRLASAFLEAGVVIIEASDPKPKTTKSKAA